MNKFHYAFNYFKKPVTLTQYQSQTLKKSFESSQKDVKPVPAVKPKKVCAHVQSCIPRMIEN